MHFALESKILEHFIHVMKRLKKHCINYMRSNPFPSKCQPVNKRLQMRKWDRVLEKKKIEKFDVFRSFENRNFFFAFQSELCQCE